MRIAAPQERSKYRNKRTHIDGKTFDSKGEAGRYVELMRLQAAGLIVNLLTQVRFPLVIVGEFGKVVREYRADFVYVEDGKRIVEDFKGCKTREYLLKRELMKALLGITIRETGGKKRANYR